VKLSRFQIVRLTRRMEVTTHTLAEGYELLLKYRGGFGVVCPLLGTVAKVNALVTPWQGSWASLLALNTFPAAFCFSSRPILGVCLVFA
jgi:hypothetical protein